MTADEAQAGDVVLDADGGCWQYGGKTGQWSTFSGPVAYYGPWLPAYGPQGELTLLVRNGHAADLR